MKNKKIFLLAFFVFLVFLTITVFAQSDLPIGLQRIIEHNQQITAEFAVKISFFIAFLAGILGILSPCILPFLPAYFSYTFKEKKNITKMTLVFFIGFSLVFVAMGIIAGFLGEQSLIVLQKGWLVSFVAIFLIIMGILSFFGKGICTYINPGKKFRNDIPGTFLFGIFFAFGWTACLGPILAGILGIGAILHNIWYSALLMFFYSIGNLVPLFILSVFYDRFNLGESKFIQGRIFSFSVFRKKYYVHSTNLISGIMFLLIGIILLVYKGTAIFNTWDIFGTKSYFYSIQNQLMGWEYANLLGIAIFILFVLVIGSFLIINKSRNRF